MSYVKMIDLLRRGEQFHKDLAAYYESLQETSRREDVKMMLDYLQRHEKFLAQTIREYEAEAPNGVINTWFQYEPEASVQQAINSVAISDDMSPEDVITLAVRLDESLTAMYAQLREMSPPVEVRETIDKLLEMEHEEKKRLVRGLQADR